MPRIQAMYDEYGAQGYVPLAINLFQDMNSVVKVYARQYSYPFFRDGGPAWTAYRMNGYIPLNYVIDTAGIVVGSMEGFNEALIRSWIEPYLTGVKEEKKAAVLELTRVFPNPAGMSQRLSFSLPAAGPVTVRVYSAAGELMRTVFSGTLMAGNHSLVWNLTDDKGKPVPNGLYFYEVAVGASSMRMKASVLR
ncbi:MAG: T9SS type A sorting domain-containing protein [candidate division WOR-3 bacterium]|nr:T9SS type A sorting domain-containing protein [candidate division WOR-3 bacterium]MCR4424208.1 T9SS type A sorting domain-containing protein [candidate division WOR-3 bacterium]MDH7519374.1 FlgD immunoglobulin-like domain containing protein [bacterium]